MNDHMVYVLGLCQGRSGELKSSPRWAPLAWLRGTICQEDASAQRGQTFKTLTKATQKFAVGLDCVGFAGAQGLQLSPQTLESRWRRGVKSKPQMQGVYRCSSRSHWDPSLGTAQPPRYMQRGSQSLRLTALCRPVHGGPHSRLNSLEQPQSVTVYIFTCSREVTSLFISPFPVLSVWAPD